jgi:20S proteasome alpha/beta subunit
MKPPLIQHHVPPPIPKAFFKKPLPLPSPAKHRKYNPWEVDMTLCIAARCMEAATLKSCVVIAHDRRIETSVAGAEIGFKFESLPRFWKALIAGPVNQAKELIEIFRVYLNENEINPDSALEQLRIPVRTLRRRLADSLTHRRVSLSYEEFLEMGKEKLSPEVYSQLAFDISQQSIEAELILIGAMDADFSIFLCQAGEITTCQDFAVIGSGSMVAEPILYQRELSAATDLPRALYVVYEAKRLGEISPGVGRETWMQVGSIDDTVLNEKTGRYEIEDVTWRWVDDARLEMIEKAFKQFGPKPIKGLQLPTVGLVRSRRSEKDKHEKADDSSASASAGQ